MYRGNQDPSYPWRFKRATVRASSATLEIRKGFIKLGLEWYQGLVDEWWLRGGIWKVRISGPQVRKCK